MEYLIITLMAIRIAILVRRVNLLEKRVGFLLKEKRMDDIASGRY